MREVLGGHCAPQLSAGDRALLHNARLQPPEVGLRHDRPAVPHEPSRELLSEAEVDDRREQAARCPGHQGVQDVHQELQCIARQGRYEGPAARRGT